MTTWYIVCEASSLERGRIKRDLLAIESKIQAGNGANAPCPPLAYDTVFGSCRSYFAFETTMIIKVPTYPKLGSSFSSYLI